MEIWSIDTDPRSTQLAVILASLFLPIAGLLLLSAFWFARDTTNQKLLSNRGLSGILAMAALFGATGGVSFRSYWDQKTLLKAFRPENCASTSGTPQNIHLKEGPFLSFTLDGILFRMPPDESYPAFLRPNGVHEKDLIGQIQVTHCTNHRIVIRIEKL